jgi:hypothetical protein
MAIVLKNYLGCVWFRRSGFGTAVRREKGEGQARNPPLPAMRQEPNAAVGR